MFRAEPRPLVAASIMDGNEGRGYWIGPFPRVFAQLRLAELNCTTRRKVWLIIGKITLLSNVGLMKAFIYSILSTSRKKHSVFISLDIRSTILARKQQKPQRQRPNSGQQKKQNISHRWPAALSHNLQNYLHTHTRLYQASTSLSKLALATWFISHTSHVTSPHYLVAKVTLQWMLS